MGVNHQHNSEGCVEVNSGTELMLIDVHDSLTGDEVPIEEFIKHATAFLESAQESQQVLIESNIDTLPAKTSKKFSSKLARENVNLPDDYDYHDDDVQTFWGVTNDKIEAARLIESHRKRKEIWDAFEVLGHDASINEVADYLGKYIDRELYKNITNSKKPPKMPEIKHPRLQYNQMQFSFCQQILFVDILWVHCACVGSRKFDLRFDAHHIYERYPNLVSLSRMSMRLNDGIHFDFTAIEDIEQRESTVNHCVAFDRNMDHARAISGVRMSSNGDVSYELGMSLQTERTIQHKKLVETDLARKKKKLKNMMPWDKQVSDDETANTADNQRKPSKYERLSADLDNVSARLDSLKDAVDWCEADDMTRHLKAGEALGIEQLDMFGGGAVKFRHGSTDDKIEHRCQRMSIPLVNVNPAGTTSTCPICHSKVKFLDDRIVECENCDWEDDRDCGSSPVIGARTLEKLGFDEPAGGYRIHDLSEREARSERKRAKRVEKMRRRAERGKRTYRVKDEATPSRPSMVLREGVSDFSMRVAETRRRISLLDATRNALDVRAAGDCSDSSFLDAVNGSPFGPWAKTNQCLFEYGELTSDAYFDELHKRYEEKQQKRKQIRHKNTAKHN